MFVGTRRTAGGQLLALCVVNPCYHRVFYITLSVGVLLVQARGRMHEAMLVTLTVHLGLMYR